MTTMVVSQYNKLFKISTITKKMFYIVIPRLNILQGQALTQVEILNDYFGNYN